MLTAPCPHCQRTVKVQERLIGKRVICPKCRGVFRVDPPDETAGAAERSPASMSYYEPEAEESRSPAAMVVGIAAGLVFVAAIGILLAVVGHDRKDDRRASTPPP